MARNGAPIFMISGAEMGVGIDVRNLDRVWRKEAELSFTTKTDPRRVTTVYFGEPDGQGVFKYNEQDIADAAKAFDQLMEFWKGNG